MYLRLAQKASSILHKHKIKEFPIPIEVIEKLLDEEDIKIIIRRNLNHSCVIENNLLIGKCGHQDKRYKLSHEYLHVMEHPGNYFTKSQTAIGKGEAQAHAFAAYLLMPVGVFEESLKHASNDFQLAEEYGVSIDLVLYRKDLTKGLYENNHYHLIDKAYISEKTSPQHDK